MPRQTAALARTGGKWPWRVLTSPLLASVLLCVFVSCTSGCANDAHSVSSFRGEDAGATTVDASAADGRSVVRGAEAGVQACPPGAPRPVNRVRFAPAPGRGERMVGGSFQGSHTSPTNDFVELAVIAETPTEGAYTELRFENDEVFRYVKYFAPEGSHGNVAEVEFYHDDTRLTGAGFGSAGAASDGGPAYQQALDGSLTTFFDAPDPTGNYVGIDIGQDAVAAAPNISPPGGTFDEAPRVTLHSSTEGAEIRYTTDGSNPSRNHGELYEGPISLSDGLTSVKAVATADCLFDSPIVRETYRVNTDLTESRGLTSYHIGNSLTDTINPWLEPIADSTGVDHTYARWTIPGSPIGWLWEHQGEGFEDPEGASHYTSFVQHFAPIDHISVQPFSDGTLSTQGEAARAMFATALAHNPDVQFWIYAQWPGETEWRDDFLARGAPPGSPDSAYPPAAENWEEATENQLRFHEAFRRYVDDGVGGKPVLLIPAGTALVNLKHAIEAGRVPGIGSFFDEHFSDDLHLSTKGAYLVSLVFYACLYQQSPEGRVTSAETGLTSAQARVYQRIAWETARDYRWSGIQPAR